MQPPDWNLNKYEEYIIRHYSTISHAEWCLLACSIFLWKKRRSQEQSSTDSGQSSTGLQFDYIMSSIAVNTGYCTCSFRISRPYTRELLAHQQRQRQQRRQQEQEKNKKKNDKQQVENHYNKPTKVSLPLYLQLSVG